MMKRKMLDQFKEFGTVVGTVCAVLTVIHVLVRVKCFITVEDFMASVPYFVILSSCIYMHLE